MKEFAILLDALSNTPSRNGKLTLLRNYFRASPDPDRGFALAALTDEMPVTIPLRRVLTELSATRFDPVLFKFSRDYVGDTAETLSLLWPDTGREGPPLRLSEIVDVVKLTSGQRIAEQIASWLDGMDTNERWALLKFLSGALRVGVSARLAKLSLAKAFGHNPEEIEELWHGLRPPYVELFQWLEGKAPRPLSADVPTFKPLMLSNPLEDKDWEALDLKDMAVEWKWDGIRVQFASKGNVVSLFSRNGDNIGAAFPEIVNNQNFKRHSGWRASGQAWGSGCFLLRPAATAQPQDGKSGSAEKYPAHIRLYDALELDGEDLRPLSFDERRKRLELWHGWKAAPSHGPVSTGFSRKQS